MMSLEQSLMEALVVLGSSADEVADRLAVLGFTGQRAVPDDCPVARYLKETLHRDDVEVSSSLCDIGEFFSFPLPEAVVNFLHRFDEEDKYPLLVDQAVAHAPECPAEADNCICTR